MIDHVEGWNPVLGLLKHAPERVREVTLRDGPDTPRVQRLREACARAGVALRELPALPARDRDERAERVAARIEPWQPADWHAWMASLDPAKAPMVVALDQVTDQGNLGAILRSAEFFGAAGVLIPKDRNAPVTPATLRASQGALLFVDVVPVTNLARALGELKELGFWVVGSALEGTPTLADVDPRQPTVLVLGAEDQGLRRLTRECCDLLVRVPGRGVTESLNVSAFAALALYDLNRARPAG